jgi:5-methyltetrahydropteroyltriglutamate--homocysteine methyltransferase
MKNSSERILTTHTGSLPRPESLIPLLREKENGQLRDHAAFEQSVKAAVKDIVRQQAQAGVDIVNDGEVSKIGYSTYVAERLTGYDLAVPGNRYVQADVAEFPEFRSRFMDSRAATLIQRPCCTGPISYKSLAEVERDIANLKEAVAGVKCEEAFLTAASPGVVSNFLENRYYRNDEEYVFAVAAAMKTEYEAIHRAGLILQLDCPDIAMTRHGRFQHLTLEEFRKRAAMHIEALNGATANIPPERMRLHLCWGNYEGPHHHDVALKDIIDLALRARPAGISYEAANPRHAHEWIVFRDVKLPPGRILFPGVLDSTTNFIEHPELIAQRICNVANLVGRENVIASSDCGFSTFAGPTRVDPQIVWRKLQAMAEGARIATRQLW